MEGFGERARCEPSEMARMWMMECGSFPGKRNVLMGAAVSEDILTDRTGLSV